MAQKPVYIDTVTHIPATWANAVSALVYDVFGLAKTVVEARQRLGLGTLAQQGADRIAITGGTIDNVVIGGVVPAQATFTQVRVTDLQPATPATLTSRRYVDNAISTSFANLSLQDMSRQRSNAVNITGGYGLYDTLRVRNSPATQYDVLTLGYYQTNLQPAQGATPFVLAADNQTVTLPFSAVAGRLVLFVDGIYQLPDQYTLTSATTVVFTSPLPDGVVIGGFRL